jgi:hypothetical protein
MYLQGKEREVIKMVKYTDIVKCRIEFLKQFDTYIRDIIDDEGIFETWITIGLPDGYDENDLKEIALDNDSWLDIVSAFNTCCVMAGVI